MKVFCNWCSKNLLLLSVVLFAFANLVVWGGQIIFRLPNYTLYSSGAAFSADGEAVKFSERMMLNHERLSHSVKVSWGGEANTAQFTGRVSQGVRGEMNVSIQESSSFGPSLIDKIQLDEDIVFNRSYFQSGHADITLLPLSTGFGGQCFYFIFMQKVQCGSKAIRSGLK